MSRPALKYTSSRDTLRVVRANLQSLDSYVFSLDIPRWRIFFMLTFSRTASLRYCGRLAPTASTCRGDFFSWFSVAAREAMGSLFSGGWFIVCEMPERWSHPGRFDRIWKISSLCSPPFSVDVEHDHRYLGCLFRFSSFRKLIYLLRLRCFRHGVCRRSKYGSTRSASFGGIHCCWTTLHPHGD